MARIQFVPGTSYQHKGRTYLVHQTLGGGRVLVENQSFGGYEQPSLKELYASWTRGEIFFPVVANPASKSRGVDHVTE